MTQTVSVHEAKTHLSRLIQEVERGHEIVITRRGEVVARIVPPRRDAGRQLGIDRGRFVVPDDFDARLPAEVLDGFER